MAEGISVDSKIVPVVGPCFSVLRLPCQGNSFSHTLISAGEFSAHQTQEGLSKVVPRRITRRRSGFEPRPWSAQTCMSV